MIISGCRSCVLVLALPQAPLPPSSIPFNPICSRSAGPSSTRGPISTRDGDPDLFVGFNGAPNRLYRNDAGVFTDVAAAAGVADARPARAAAWGDSDADGDPDLLVGFAPGQGAAGVRRRRCCGSTGTTAGRFTDVAGRRSGRSPPARCGSSRGSTSTPTATSTCSSAFRDRPNAMFRNEAGAFTDVAPELGLADPRKSVGAVWFDADEDGDLDLYVGNMDGDANGLFRNDGGRFTDVAAGLGLEWGGRAPGDAANGTVRPCAADVDGDGRLDLFMANYGPNGLFLNRGGGRFEDVSQAWGVAIDGRYDACAFADIDHDGRLDLYVNGTVTGGTSYRDYLFRSRPRRSPTSRRRHSWRFTPITACSGPMPTATAIWISRSPDRDPTACTRCCATGSPRRRRSRSLFVRVLDGRGRATRAGAEVRVLAAGTRRVLARRSGRYRIRLQRAERPARAHRPADQRGRGRRGDVPGRRPQGDGALRAASARAGDLAGDQSTLSSARRTLIDDPSID